MKSPSEVTKSLDEFVLVREILLNFLSHVEYGAVATKENQRML